MRGPTQLARSNIMKRSAFSCGVAGALEQPVGNGQPCVGPKLQALALHTPPLFVQQLALHVLMGHRPEPVTVPSGRTGQLKPRGSGALPGRDTELVDMWMSVNTIRP